MENTSFFVPNDYLLRVARRFPELFIPCISINPKRQDAIDELERRVEQGARVLKIHPPIQNVDPGEPRFRPFYRTCSQRGVIVMVHTGTEHSAEIVGNEYSAPQRLVIALEEGCTVVAAHSGMSAFFDKEDFFPQLLALVRRFPNLYCDTAVLGDKFRWRNLPRLIDTDEVLERTITAVTHRFPRIPLSSGTGCGRRSFYRYSQKQTFLNGTTVSSRRSDFLRKSLSVAPGFSHLQVVVWSEHDS